MTLPGAARAVPEPPDRSLPPLNLPTLEPPVGLGVASRSWLPSLGSPDISMQSPNSVASPTSCERTVMVFAERLLFAQQ